MAKQFYPSYLDAVQQGSINLLTDTIKAALVDSGVYTFSTAHDFYNDVSAGVAGTPQALTSKTLSGGALDAADLTYAGVVAAGSVNSVEAVVLYKDTGTPSTSPLICYLDGVTLTLNGSDVIVTWGAYIFKLGATA